MKCEIWLVRHGETEWNIEKRWQGQRDIPLNTKGQLQAKAVAEYLFQQHALSPFTQIYSRYIYTLE